MELRQLRYFVRVVELGSMGRAALDLNVVQSALSQQISRLETELASRLLQRTPRGVTPTEAGTAFFREAQLTLRHAEQAARVAKQTKLTGTVSVGLAPTTAAMLGLPLMKAMRERYPDIRLHLVEGMSGHLTTMLNARELDLAMLFDAQESSHQMAARRLWQSHPLLSEDLYLISARTQGRKHAVGVTLAQLGDVPLILPTGPHGLRSTIDLAFARTRQAPCIVMEVDSLSMVMAAVEAGLGSTLQPYSALGRYRHPQERFSWACVCDSHVHRVSLLCSLPEQELSSAALATRIVAKETVRTLVDSGAWHGTKLRDHDS
ncbi:LysR family transcriptional regulator (plasmid) [Alicycliphilus denitrificans]|uniref:LysR family transcriptional regulator n=1 Tax=Alicycliphilus denitrificans TaxID=179636 RepID=A0A858ZNF5_9BURK|nr:LysR substrate-binding domain-containing protein [Alicycliphilus denitrificans]QKD42101.1 LysR family transcriptional regulator [Alicycliphilus denitrificans]